MLRGVEKGYLREIMKTGEAETRNHETALWFLKMSQVLSLPSFLPSFLAVLGLCCCALAFSGHGVPASCVVASLVAEHRLSSYGVQA